MARVQGDKCEPQLFRVEELKPGETARLKEDDRLLVCGPPEEGADIPPPTRQWEKFRPVGVRHCGIYRPLLERVPQDTQRRLDRIQEQTERFMERELPVLLTRLFETHGIRAAYSFGNPQFNHLRRGGTIVVALIQRRGAFEGEVNSALDAFESPKFLAALQAGVEALYRRAGHRIKPEDTAGEEWERQLERGGPRSTLVSTSTRVGEPPALRIIYDHGPGPLRKYWNSQQVTVPPGETNTLFFARPVKNERQVGWDHNPAEVYYYEDRRCDGDALSRDQWNVAVSENHTITEFARVSPLQRQAGRIQEILRGIANTLVGHQLHLQYAADGALSFDLYRISQRRAEGVLARLRSDLQVENRLPHGAVELEEKEGLDPTFPRSTTYRITIRPRE